MLKYDPKLREAALEFEAICKKYDCGGFALFASPTHAEFINHLSPSWSVVSIIDSNVLRFRSKKEDFSSQEEQHRCTEATVHMLTSLIEWSRQVNSSMRSVIERLSKQMGIVWQAWDRPDSVPGDGQ